MATVNLFFDTRATLEHETVRRAGIIKIVVTHNRVKRRYTTGLKVTLDQWQHLPKKGEKLDNRVKDEIRLKLNRDIDETPNGFYRRAETITETLGVNFDFDAFKDAFDNWGKDKPSDDTNNVFAALKAKADTMRKVDRVGNASNYELAAKSLGRYVESMDNPTRKDLGLPLRPRGVPSKATKRNEEVKPAVLPPHTRIFDRLRKLDAALRQNPANHQPQKREHQSHSRKPYNRGHLLTPP
jgi:hypothetical protein